MSQSPIQAAIQQICQEKNISEESVLRTIDLALAAAYRKDFGNKLQNIVVNFNVATGEIKVTDVKTVVEDIPEEELTEDDDEVEDQLITAGAASYSSDEDGEIMRRFNPRTEIQLKDAKELDAKYEIGDEIITELEVPGEFGRMAAQTAKQVIIQKIREEERRNIFDEYKEQERQVIGGTIQRREGNLVFVDLGHTIAVMPPEEQIERERYAVGNRLKFYLKLVDQTTRGIQLVVSRVHNDIVRRVFESEIPEIANGTIEIKAISRDPGNRSKVAIMTNDENIDPIGSCVGQRGTRIQTIIAELNGEKIDIILWDEDPIKFIINSLSPAKVGAVNLIEKEGEKKAVVTVSEDQLSLAIGKAGQNVRLASRLTGWKIDIISDGAPIKAKEESDETEESTDQTVSTEEAEAVAVEPEVETETKTEEEVAE